MRRDFSLTEEDVECLDGKGLDWEAVLEGSTKWVFLRKYPIPDSYNATVADVALRLPPLYPDDQIDMVYFHPPLALKSGKAMNALTPHTIEGKQYQQWSRHRTSENPWRPGLDNICTHLLQVDSWLYRELPKVLA
jgi:E2/UBC family protein E